MSQPTRSLWGVVLKNFINSFKPRQITGTLKGTDYFGNKYFEIAANPDRRLRRERWFEPPQKDNFEQELPAEWEAWLRGRRREPPTQEELQKNLAIMQMKKKNAIAVEAKAGKMTPMTKGVETFPKYEDLEMTPGKKRTE